MKTNSVWAWVLLATVASTAHAATGNLVVFDDADENGFDHAAAICSNGYYYEETSVVHSGTAAMGISKQFDNNGAGWGAPTNYSASSDYDGVAFWVNSGNTQSTLTSLAVYDMDGNPHFAHLEDIYGASLPAGTWIHFDIPFGSPYFAAAYSTPPATVQAFCVITHSPSGSPSDVLYLDDVALTGADIFKDGFGN